MKITVKQLKQLIREQVEEVGYGMQEAGRRPVPAKLKLLDLAKQALSDEEFDQYIVISPTHILVPDLDRPEKKFVIYDFDGVSWAPTNHTIDLDQELDQY